MDVYGTLVKAQFENLGSDPGGTPPTGLAWFNTSGVVVKYYNGAAIKTFVETDTVQTLTGKYFNGGTASTTNRFKIPNDTATNLATLATSLTEGDFVYDTTNHLPCFKSNSGLITMAAAVDASVSLTGSVNTSAQSFGGLKKFEGGMIQVGTIDTSTTDQTLTNTSSRHITYTSLSGNINVTLATTSVKSGEIWTICNTTSKMITLKSSDGDIIGSQLGTTPNSSWGVFHTGFMVVKALQDTPTDRTHWQVLDYYSEYIHSTTFIGNGSGSSAGASFDLAIKRRMNFVTIDFPANIRVTTAGSSTGIDSTTPLPAQYRPDSSGGCSFPAGVRQAAGDSSGLGVIRVTNSGASPGGITIWKDNAASAFSDGANAGLSNNVAAVWTGYYNILR